ncbi:MAG: PAS domain S-box protein [Candidatus Woesearchaeota archaeon]
MGSNNDILQEIQKVLRERNMALTVQQISKEIGINRNAVAKYMDVLTATGQVKRKKIGPAKLFTLARRIPISNMMNLAKEFFLVIDEQTNIIDINTSVTETLNTTKETLIGKDITVFRNRFDIELDNHNGFQAIQKALRGEQTSLDYQITHKERTMNFEAKFIPTCLNDGSNGVTIILEDISDKKRIEQERTEALEKARQTKKELEKQQSLFMGGPVALFHYRNEEGWPVEYVSGSFLEMLGRGAKESRNEAVKYTDLIHEEDVKKVLTEAREFERKGFTHFSHSPYRIRTKNGASKWVSAHTRIIRDEHGTSTHHLSYIIDIASIKQQEEQHTEKTVL